MTDPVAFDVLLDRAAAAREVGILIACALIRTHGDADAALSMLSDFDGLVLPGEGELDCVPIAAQAIRDAVGLGVVPK